MREARELIRQADRAAKLAEQMASGDLEAEEIEKLLNGDVHEQHTVRFKTADESVMSREFVLGSEIQKPP